MNVFLLLFAALAVYFLLLLALSRGRGGNDAFFRAGRRSSWPVVAFGMIGASVSGVSFVSVPGWVRQTDMTYLQMCAGFFFGYVAVAFLLLPLYYRLRLTSIYTFLRLRFGPRTHRTGALFFLLSKLTGAAARLYLVIVILQQFTAGALPFALTAALVLLLIWGYTRRGGTGTLVRTDALQTFCMLLALGGMVWAVCARMDLGFADMVATVRQSPMSRVLCWEGPQSFWRQFLSGIFIVVVMTGLDQDMMQKNLTCRTLRDAQKDMCAYGLCFVPVNLALLALGVLLYAFCAREGIEPPAQADALLPSLVAGGRLGGAVVFPFAIGVAAAAFSSADSALTSLTTSCCVDLLGVERRGWTPERQERVRRRVHALMALAFLGCVLVYRAAGSGSIINAIYVMASYTYGPLLGLYAFGLLNRRHVRDGWVPVLCLASPLVCAALDVLAPVLWGYTFGYELLMLNGLLTFGGLLAASRPATKRRTSACTR